METSNTSAFAGFALQVICRQEWVRERCLQDPQKLCSPELLLDPAISPNQVRFPFFTPLRPNSDLSQTSHYNIMGLSVREVVRIENMITQILLIF